MRKIFLCIAIVFSSIYCSAITVNEMLQKYQKAESAVIMNKNRCLQLADVDHVYIVVLNYSSNSIKKSFKTDFHNLKDENYDIDIKMKEDDRNILILKTKDSVTPKCMAIFVFGEDDYIIVTVEGELDLNNLEHVLKNLNSR